MPSAPARCGLLACASAASHLVSTIVAGAIAVAMLGTVGSSRAAAQEQSAVSIRAAATIPAAASSEIALPIEIGPPGAIPKGSFVTLRGLPPGVALRDGHAVGPGWWAIPISALPSLTAQVPDGLSGRSEIVISLIATDGRLLAQDRSALVIRPSLQTGAAVAPPRGLTPPAPELSDDQRMRAERLFARGEAYLVNGNIMGARDFFERAADAGLPAAALQLAATYDPEVLKRLKAQSVAPDTALARKWYERARELGSAEAGEALIRLGSQ
jgi:hypothetical protein